MGKDRKKQSEDVGAEREETQADKDGNEFDEFGDPRLDSYVPRFRTAIFQRLYLEILTGQGMLRLTPDHAGQDSLKNNPTGAVEAAVSEWDSAVSMVCDHLTDMTCDVMALKKFLLEEIIPGQLRRGYLIEKQGNTQNALITLLGVSRFLNQFERDLQRSVYSYKSDLLNGWSWLNEKR